MKHTGEHSEHAECQGFKGVVPGHIPVEFGSRLIPSSGALVTEYRQPKCPETTQVPRGSSVSSCSCRSQRRTAEMHSTGTQAVIFQDEEMLTCLSAVEAAALDPAESHQCNHCLL